MTNPYEVPVIDIIGPTEIAGFFQNLYAIMTPAMPFLMIAVATALAGYLITVVRTVFGFGNVSGKENDYEYNEDYSKGGYKND
jgi:hypothetical protein